MNSYERRHELKEFLKGCHILKGKEKFITPEKEEKTTINSKFEYRSCSRKRRYSSLGEATQRANFHTKKGHGNFRAYYCEICKGYHLTHGKYSEEKAKTIDKHLGI